MRTLRTTTPTKRRAYIARTKHMKVTKVEDMPSSALKEENRREIC